MTAIIRDMTISPAKYWTDTRILICKSHKCVYNNDSECKLKHLNIGVNGQCMSYVTEQRPQYRTDWESSPAYALLDKANISRYSFGSSVRIYGSIARSYGRGFDGSIEQLAEIVSGKRKVRNIGPIWRRKLSLALGKVAE